jgi:hypothetical protein
LPRGNAIRLQLATRSGERLSLAAEPARTRETIYSLIGNVQFPDMLLELDAAGGILRTVNFGAGTTPKQPAFDGANLWVPLGEDSVAVVRASDGAVLTALTGNGIHLGFSLDLLLRFSLDPHPPPGFARPAPAGPRG